MITIKSPGQVELMRAAGRISKRALIVARDALGAGVTTAEVDAAVERFIRSAGATPSFLGYNGFPASICISVNDEVIHGIPGPRKLRDGDVVSVDVGAIYNGYHGDNAATFAIGSASDEAKRLIEVTRAAFYEALKFARAGNRVSDISHAIQLCAENHGFSVVRPYVGHGIGTAMHESPEIPNFGNPGHGPRLAAGMTIAIEPMVNAGGYEVKLLSDGWTVVTRDGRPSAHYENTVLITDGEPELLTVADEVL